MLVPSRLGCGGTYGTVCLLFLALLEILLVVAFLLLALLKDLLVVAFLFLRAAAHGLSYGLLKL